MRRKHSSVVRALRNDPRVLQRFWTQVRLSADEQDCWQWIGAVTPGGYPSFRIAGRSIAASHVTWFTAVGELPEGGRVKRRCGNALCVRPTHLAWALSPMLERTIQSLGDGYVPLAGHVFLPAARAPRDPRVLRTAVSGTGTSSSDGARAPDDNTDDATAAA
jgi:hypothetical protein